MLLRIDKVVSGVKRQMKNAGGEEEPKKGGEPAEEEPGPAERD